MRDVRTLSIIGRARMVSQNQLQGRRMPMERLMERDRMSSVHSIFVEYLADMDTCSPEVKKKAPAKKRKAKDDEEDDGEHASESEAKQNGSYVLILQSRLMRG